jgi:hypothetical protein
MRKHEDQNRNCHHGHQVQAWAQGVPPCCLSHGSDRCQRDQRVDHDIDHANAAPDDELKRQRWLPLKCGRDKTYMDRLERIEAGSLAIQLFADNDLPWIFAHLFESLTFNTVDLINIAGAQVFSGRDQTGLE